ncbi:MAG: amino-acid N-acetyltransferase, partial [Opitutales bacterium]|nr:amino-acid N-acetyltransferase [Opitutales bacterium]
MVDNSISESTIKPTDLRGILKYVPMFREQIFVIAIDGSLVAHENFQNVLLDIAVLRSLNIHVVLVHGAGLQLRNMAETSGIEITNP